MHAKKIGKFSNLFLTLKTLLALLLQPFLVTLDIKAFHKGYTNHIKHDNQEKAKEIGAIERGSLQN